MKQETAVAEQTIAHVENPEALRAEVAKWQERVPKLASALRERTDELASARDEIRQLKKQLDGSGSDVARRAREELIEELEAKAKSLRSKVQSLGGELHSAQLALTEAQEEADSWKSRWQEVTVSLDEASALQAHKETELEKAQDALVQERRRWQEEIKQLKADQQTNERMTGDLAALRKRNEQLVETTEMANTQLVTLGEELSTLVKRAEESESALNAALEQETQTAHKLDDLRNQLAQSEDALTQARSELAEKELTLETLLVAAQDEHHKALSELETQHDASRVELRTAHQNELAEVRSAYERTLAEKSDEINRHLDEISELTSRLESGESDVEQAALIHRQELERLAGESTRLGAERDEVQAEVDRLQACLLQAQEIQDRFESERELQIRKIAALEEEVAQAELSVEQKSIVEQALQEKVEKLEVVLEERTDLLHTLEEERNVQMRDGTHLTGNIERLEKELEGTRQRADTLKAHAETLETKLNDQRELMDELECELSEEQDKLVEQRRMTETEKRLRSELEKQISESQENQYKEKLERLQQDKDASEAAFNEKAARLEEELSNHRDQVDSQLGELQSARADLEAANERTADLTRAIEALQREQDDLRAKTAEYAEVREQKDSLTVQLEASGLALSQTRNELTQVQQDAQRAQAELVALKAESVDAMEVQTLQEQVRELENKFRERTQELNDLRWRAEQEKVRAQSADESADEKMTLVLSQQLEDARDEIERLKSKLKQEKNRDQSAGAPAEFDATDLTQLKGVGDKLAEQLTALGITNLEQISEMTEQDLDNEDHLLFGYRSRMLRDGWIDQARELLGK